MAKRFDLIQQLAWVYAGIFLLTVAISHWPGLTDSQGRLLGLFFIDPIDDIFHLLSGVGAVVAALHSSLWSRWYFILVAIPYGLDALTGLLFSRQFLNLDVFTMGLGGPDFSVPNILVNLPHIALTVLALWIGLSLAPKLAKAQ